MSTAIFSASVTVTGHLGLNTTSEKLFPTKDSVAWTRKTVSNGSRIHCMKTLDPIDNKKLETLSYVPPLSDESIMKQIDHMMANGWVPCLEFDEVGYVHRTNSRMPGGRYWTLWKLPMFGCTDSSLVLQEINKCKKTYPNAYIRCMAFDSKHQCQCMCLLSTRSPSSLPLRPLSSLYVLKSRSTFIVSLLCFRERACRNENRQWEIRLTG